MRSIKEQVKQSIKNTSFFQEKKMNEYFRLRESSINRLTEREKPNRTLLCPNKGTSIEDKVNQLSFLLSKIEIKIEPESRFQIWIDVGLYTYHHFSITDNVPPNYEIVISSFMKEMKQKYSKNNNFGLQEIRLLDAIEKYINRIIKELNVCLLEVNGKEKQNIEMAIKCFKNMLSKPAVNLYEALQRIVFWSSLFWQTQHRLVGIGRLDKILDGMESKLSDKEIIGLIQDFNVVMHKYYAFKSNDLMGDTGQIIVLGGLNEKGEYFSNRLTYSFIKASLTQNFPDPKLLLRVSDKMPDELLNLAIKCITTGVGYPLLANDDVIIPSISPIYGEIDACNYVTSACWEPLIYGKSLDKNNLSGLNFAKAFVDSYRDEKFVSCCSIKDVKNIYFIYLDKELERVISKIERIKWEPDPLSSLLTEGCDRKDISCGGAVYNNYGILGVGLSNAVNSLLAIIRYVFREKKYSLSQLQNACFNNYVENEDIRIVLKNVDEYGSDHQEAVQITKEIVEYVYDHIKTYRNQFGGVLKFGLSASNYKESGDNTKATMDGRLDGDSLGVHISSHGSNAYTELVSFASMLNYNELRCNGNVVDFFVSPSIFSKSRKFIEFVKSSIKIGFFQMQMNVVDSGTLIAAKERPEDFQNLIVRVWGFSAYFNELPEEYKNLLIERALQSEGIA